MTYRDTVRYLDSFVNYEKKARFPYTQSFKLERTKIFLEGIGNPQNSLRCIHVAGTKGKGSTCVFIASILKEAGLKVGLYTSPHLSDVRERIRILCRGAALGHSESEKEYEGMISKKALVALVRKLKPAIDRFSKESAYGPLSFFEVYTALAFSYFKSQKVDAAVLETGLGGRLDATNVADPLVCAITPVSFDHTSVLGATLQEIAAQKAGIIKSPKAIVVSAPQKSAVIKVIRERCAQVGARLWEWGRDIRAKKTRNGFSVSVLGAEYNDLKINLLGPHQIINAALGVGAIRALRENGIRVEAAAIGAGLRAALWPGRCEVVARKPLVVLDGAQNRDSCRVLKKAVKENFSYRNLVLVLGISRDKDIRAICDELADFAECVILTKSNNPRAAEPAVLARHFSKGKIHLSKNVAEARRIAKRLAGKDDLVLVCGSLFVVGEYRLREVRI